MAKLRIDVDGILMDGHEVVFKAPCDCSEFDGIKVYYVENATQQSKEFTMKDAHGNVVIGLGNLFGKDAYVKAILDTKSNVAYIQNSDTNGYLEGKFAEIIEALGGCTLKVIPESEYEALGEGRPENTLYLKIEG